MNLQMIYCDELFLLTAFKEENIPTSFLSEKLKTKDYLSLIIDKKLAALLQISAFRGDKAEIHFLHIIEEEFRPLLLGRIRDVTIKHDEDNVIPESFTKTFLDFFDDFHNSLHMYYTEIDYFYAKALKENQKKQKETSEDKMMKKLVYSEEDKPKSDSIHSKTQHLLKELAKITSCDVWMASNDKNRDYKGDRLGDDTLENFPNFNIDSEAKKRIALIDTLWFREDQVLCAFEAEITSSVYSGILRMADLVSVIPNLNMKLYIVAPLSRKEKVLRELSRPLFQRIGLSDYCKFISLESLEVLYQKVKGLDGYVSYDVMDAISVLADSLEKKDA